MEKKEIGKSGIKVSALGIGTYGVGGFETRDESRDDDAVNMITKGIELGMTFIDTAEMYGQGHSEELVSQCIEDTRNELFITTKVWPTNLAYDELIKSCKESLKRLKTDYIDLYLIHWPNPEIQIKESMRAMEYLYKEGLIRSIGVSNFSVDLIQEARDNLSVTDIVANQVPYSLINRGVEEDILPYCQKEGINVIAYTPLGKGKFLFDKSKDRLETIGKKYGKTASQVALNWLIQKEGVFAIPKTLNIDHLIENSKSTNWRMTESDYRLVDEFD